MITVQAAVKAEMPVQRKEKLTDAQLQQKVDAIKAQVFVGQEYYHYANPSVLYTVIEVGFDVETLEPVVVYRPKDGMTGVWVRKLSAWTDIIETEQGATQRFVRAH